MASAAEEVLFEQASITDQDAAKYFGIAIGSLVALFALSHWTRWLASKYVPCSSTLARMSAAIIRPIRRTAKGIVVGGVLVLPGRIALALLYLAINVVLTFTNVDWSQQTLFAKRLGWMALCNLCLAIFLGLKNTPLSPIAGRSYESLNVLHRCVGYTTILYMVLHSTIYVSGLAKAGAFYVMDMPGQYAGATAGLAMLLIFVTAVGFVRKRQYELFYVVHVVLVAVVLATVGFHTYQPPSISPKTLVIVLLASALWVLDRSIRLATKIYYGIGNYCTLTPLPEGATRVTMRRSIKATPGSHVFLWIPGVRMLQTHPFTLLSNEPVAEFVIAAGDGFTKHLHSVACENPQARFKAGLEGPYGITPNPREFDKVVLLAGGSGATFTLALALHWAKNIRLRKYGSTLEFVWTVKNKSYLHWFDAELAELQACPAVSVRIHVTGNIADETDSCSSESFPSLSWKSTEKEKVLEQAHQSSHSAFGASGSASLFSYDRPDVDAIVGRAVAAMPSTKRVLVAAAGPSGMMTDTRAAASSRMVAGLPSVHLHLEAYGW